MVALWLSLALPAAAQEEGADLALSLVNEVRKAEGLDALALEPALMQAAQAHADDMLARDYYSHESPEGGTVRDRFLDAGGSRWNLVAENIAMCEGCDDAGAQRVRAFHSGWMQSRGHRRNILMPGLDGFGFAVVAADGEVYAVQTFAGAGTAPGGNRDPAEPAQVREMALDVVNADRREAGQPPLEPSEALDILAQRMADRATMEGEALSLPDDPFGLLPDGADGWRGVSVSAAACTGCGAAPAEGDGGHFGAQMQPAGDAGAFTHFGFALSANGDGRKIAVGVFGQR